MNLHTLSFAGFAALAFAAFLTPASSEQPKPEHLIEHNPVSTITPSDKGEMPTVGPYKESQHNETMRGITASVAQEGCDRLGRRFVASVNHMAFIRECWASHHRILTHVPPEKLTK